MIKGGLPLDRAAAMAIMARASRSQLATLWREQGEGITPALLLAPETGMVRLTTQAGLSGPRFQFGEATATRCVVEWRGLRGYAVHLGSDAEKAECAASLDLLVQCGRAEVLTALQGLSAEQQAKADLAKARANASKVRFYTTKTSG